MTYMEFVAAAIAAIWFLIGVVKYAFPWLEQQGSRYIPVITLLLGVGVAVYCHVHYAINAVEALLTAVIPMLGSSGIHSVKNVVKNDYME